MTGRIRPEDGSQPFGWELMSMSIRRFLMVGFLAIGSLLLIAGAAHAVSIPGCGDFLFFSKSNIIMENGATDLTGNIFSQTGKISVGEMPHPLLNLATE